MTLLSWLGGVGTAAVFLWSAAAEKPGALDEVEQVMPGRRGQATRISRPDADPLPVRDIAEGRNFTWTPEQASRPLRFRAGQVTLTIRNTVSEVSDDLVQPRITVEAPGRRSQVIRGTDSWPIGEHMIGIGELDRSGKRFVYYQGFSGGAHCCRVQIVAVVTDRAIEIVELGSWDGAPVDEFPRDVNGDGTVDFVERDDRFRYAFGGGGASYGPPQILNISPAYDWTRAVDVSLDPSFRHLYAAQMREAGRQCLTDQGGSGENADCAVYVAAAARIGRLDEAWRNMLRSYNRQDDYEFPTGCRFILTEHQDCPANAAIRFTNFPEALRHFLRENGYIAL